MKLFEKVKEKIIKKINDDLIFYDDNLYRSIGMVKSRNKRNVEVSVNGETIPLTRMDAHNFKDETGRVFIIDGNTAYLLDNTNKENYKNLKPIIVDYQTNQEKDINENSLIEGDNLAVLELMQGKYYGKVDFISIDPPYNTRNKDMRYNDFFPVISGNDQHSAWLSFMNERLLLAKNLLSEEGVIFINIDEYEYPYLKILCDNIFDEKNLIETFIWEKNSTKNNSNTTSNNHEYIICFAKNKKIIERLGYFRKNKEGLNHINDIILKYKNNKSENLSEIAQNEIREFYKNNKDLKGIKQYKFVDKNLNVYRISDVSAPNGNGTNYDLIHPITEKVCKKPAGGLRYTKETIEQHLRNNRFHFGKDEKTVPQYKRYLSEVESEVWKSVIKNTDEGKKDLEKIFGQSPFNNAKPISLLKSLISMVNKKEMICLDFFAGSASLGHAVVEYNKENKTNHSFILITNNESNIFVDVSIPRMKKITKNIDVSKVIFK